ncbi:hypothetical protein GOP47_0019154 [Adiantum capillus-veneris]|uniref:Riboflavin biosynthesis protein PYRD, chloroplastic n=1 Tax=Adiantum capillus-veneris TaxID=13818 RepID=A0A9D4UEQ7_ADICA|nr:hypothetical protein GOP47_0019154 [Adiantum capillus-veneris]
MATIALPSQQARLTGIPLGCARLTASMQHQNYQFPWNLGSIALELRPRMHPLRAVLSASLPIGATEADAEYMHICVKLARKASGFTSPNPMVGCVIVKDGHIVGQGFHPKAGEPHAEVFALREAGENAEGATAYVSLEPCNHYGRTPPCTTALIKACVSKVVVGMLDPNPIVSGKGVETLKKAGIEVVPGVETPICEALNEAYIYRMLEKKPFVSLRFSVSLDGGFIESSSVDCSAGSYFSKLLQETDAVIVHDSALSDNPVLLSAETGSKQPLRIVLSHDLKLPLASSIFDTTSAPTLVIASEQAVVLDLEASSRTGSQSMESLLRERGIEVMVLQELSLMSVLDVCYERGFCSVLLDSRGRDPLGLHNPLGKLAVEERVVQKVIVDVFPTVTGHNRAGPGFVIDGGALPVERVRSRMSGSHVIIEGYLPR